MLLAPYFHRQFRTCRTTWWTPHKPHLLLITFPDTHFMLVWSECPGKFFFKTLPLRWFKHMTTRPAGICTSHCGSHDTMLIRGCSDLLAHSSIKTMALGSPKEPWKVPTFGNRNKFSHNSAAKTSCCSWLTYLVPRTTKTMETWNKCKRLSVHGFYHIT